MHSTLLLLCLCEDGGTITEYTKKGFSPPVLIFLNEVKIIQTYCQSNNAVLELLVSAKMLQHVFLIWKINSIFLGRKSVSVSYCVLTFFCNLL